MPTSYNAGAGYFLYVGDISEVYNYNVPQGNAMFFMNKTQPVMYLKSVNMFNQQTVTTYDLLERKAEVPMGTGMAAPAPAMNPANQQPVQNQANDPSEYVTKGELASIIQETIRSEMRNNRKNYKKEE